MSKLQTISLLDEMISEKLKEAEDAQYEYKQKLEELRNLVKIKEVLK